MKLTLYILLLITLTNCHKKGCIDKTAVNFSTEHTKDDGSCIYKQSVKTVKEKIPFEGVWSRQFEAGIGSGFWHTVSFSVYQDSIRYTLNGPVGNANYIMLRDTFVLENNRYIGHTPTNIYYLIFTKEITIDSIKIYKEIIPSFEKGMSIVVPHDTTTANHGWSYYSK